MVRSFVKTFMLFIVIFSSFLAVRVAEAQNRVAIRSDDFREVMVTAAYATAYGAAGGAALLAFVPGSPINNLRIVAGGASLGFLFGSALGFYNATQMAANVEPNGLRNEMYSREGNGDEYPEEQTMQRSAPDCMGTRVPSLLMGCSNRLDLALPVVALSDRQMSVSLLDWRF